MKKILISLGIIGVVAAIVIGATSSFLSDTETSSGNTFTAGELNLKIDNSSYYNGVFNPGTSWLLADSLLGKLFFDFHDLKPGDWGEDTISLRTENDAWACMEIDLTAWDDNGITEPEGDDGDTTGGPNEGELQNEIYFIWWADDGDNVLETDEVDSVFFQENLISALDGLKVTLADSSGNGIFQPGTNNDPLDGDATYYMGKAWCFGDFTLTPITQDGFGVVDVNPQDGFPDNGPAARSSGVDCDGTLLDNTTQTDSVVGDITFTAVQSRHNPNFRCGPPQERPGTLTVNKILSPENDNGKFNLQIDGVTKATDVGNGGTTGAQTVSAGAHTVGEVAGTGTNLSDYTTVIGGDADCSDGNVTVPAIGSVTCTITNTHKTTQLTTLKIVKTVINDNGGTATEDNFGLKIDGGPVSNNVAIPVNAGPHTASETGLAGYSASAWGGDCDANGNVNVAIGQNKTCTITNDDIQPKLHVIKHVVNTNGGTKLASDFSITVTGASPSPATFNGAESGTLVMLNAGGYSVDEAAVSNYTKNLSTDCSGAMLPGDEKTCTITNTFTCFDQGDVMLVLDRSGSISSSEMSQLKTAALAFVTAMAPDGGVHMGQTSFQTTGILNTQLTGVAATINTGINNLTTSSGYTNLFQGISLASTELASVRDRALAPNYMIIITDGNPNRPTPTSNAIAQALAAATTAKGSGTTIYVVGVGSDVNAAYLQTIASPGKYYGIGDYSGLQVALTAIATCQTP